MFIRRCVLVLVTLSLLILLVPACGNDNDETTPTTSQTTAPTATIATPTATTTDTPAPTTSGVVKIGHINSWSGPAAMSGSVLADPIIKLVKWQVEQQGGILGGKALEVVKFDDGGSVAGDQAGVTKLSLDDEVGVIVGGGASGTAFVTISDACEEARILNVSIAHVDDLAKYKFAINATVQRESARQITLDYINDVIKPKKVAYLGTDDDAGRQHMPFIREGLEAAGAETVYFEYYSLATSDFSSLLTRIKYENPDFLYTYTGSNENYMTIARQIMELDGWGDITVFAQPSGLWSAKMPGAQGWYMLANYISGAPDNPPAAVKFEEDYAMVIGGKPNTTQVYYYNAFWTAIKAIELAGTDTDRVAIAEAARSGKLEWDTPMGHAKWGADGDSGLVQIVAIVKDKQLVKVPMP